MQQRCYFAEKSLTEAYVELLIPNKFAKVLPVSEKAHTTTFAKQNLVCFQSSFTDKHICFPFVFHPTVYGFQKE